MPTMTRDPWKVQLQLAFIVTKSYETILSKDNIFLNADTVSRGLQQESFMLQM
jgi:hypothetical protein